MLTSGGEEQQRLERPEDLGTDDRALVRYWLMEIDNAGQVMKNWEQDTDRICKKYRDENRGNRTGNRFNILAANINTMRPALYNSTPIPDIRRRNQGITDPVTRDAAAVMERAVSLSLEDGRFDEAIRSAIMDMLQGGRGVVRVRNTPIMSDGNPIWYSVCAERVSWKDFRHQPESEWALVNWIAFRHYLDREQLEELNPADGARVRLDHSVAAEDTGGTYGKTQAPTDVFKRAAVWEIWDKRTMRCLFVAPSWKKRPLKIEDDPLRLEQFFPVAPPIWADKDPDSMVPLPDYRLYEDLASELDEITRRIQALIRVCKWRGIYNAAMNMIAQLETADDGDLKPVEMVDPTVSLENYVWLMPVERVVQVLQQLYQQRQEILGTIYEITGLSDIIRGNTDPDETLGSQRIKAQWASGKLSTRQGDVQRLCRDIIRMESEIIVEHWPPDVLSAMTGIMVTPQISQLLTSDQLRMWKIDVETDSTIQADLSDARENIGQLIEGIGSFVQAMAPAVQTGLVTGGEAIKLLSAFSKPFRLGRTAEQVFDEMVAKQEQQEQLPQQGPPPDPKMLEVQANMQLEERRQQFDEAYRIEQLKLEYKKAGLDGVDAEAVKEAAMIKAQSDAQIAQAKVPYELQTMQISLSEAQAKAADAAWARQAERDRQIIAITAEKQKKQMELEALAAIKQAQIARAQAEATKTQADTQIALTSGQHQAEVDKAEADSLVAKEQIDIQIEVETAKRKSEIEVLAAQQQAELEIREKMALADDARRHREIEEKAFIRQREAELALVEAQAAIAAADARAKQAEIDGAATQPSVLMEEANMAIAVDAAKNKKALELEAAKQKAELELREQMAIAEDARRHREIEEKAFIRQKEAELALIEAQAAAAKAQAMSASAEAMAKHGAVDAENQRLQLELQMMREKAQFDAEQREAIPERQEQDSRNAEMLTQMMQQQAEMLNALVQVVSAPKMVVRDTDGVIVGTRTIMQ